MKARAGAFLGMAYRPLAFVLAFTACNSSSSGTQPAPASKVVVPPPADAAPLPPLTLSVADVNALVAAWLAAQNDGDFSAYEKLYAAKLEGVKRARGRTWRFDRAGWLADRKRMFAHPMKVTAADVTVHVLAGTAIVELTQAFAQGTFQDEGTKRIVVVLEQGVARIAREEMLQSRSAVPIGADASVFLVDASTIYLQRDPDENWGAGPKSLQDTSDLVLATQQLGNAPAAVKAWRGKTLAAYTADGTRCTATIGDVRLQAGQTPHFGTRTIWRGDADEPAYSDEEIANEVFGAGDKYLVGDATFEGGCAPVVALTAPAPVFFPETPDADLADSATRAFAKLPEYRAIQREYAASGGKGAWATTPAVHVFGTAEQTRYVFVSDAQGAGCGEFSGSLWAAWSIAPGGKLKPLPLDRSGTWTPIAVFDSDGDGRIEMVGNADRATRYGTYQTYFSITLDTLEAAETIEYSFLDCTC